MAMDPAQAREAVRDQWMHAASAWTNWHPKMSQSTREVTEALCQAAELRPGLAVLDVAGGTGEPSLTAARAVAPGGTVTYTDLIPEMRAAAEANARAAGIDNMTFREVDIENIPFDDAAFDRVISRFGIMFPLDTQKALSQVRRVLKPGGRVAFATWQDPLKNDWFIGVQKLFVERGLVTPPPPGMPGPFRFAEPGLLPSELEKAGFRDIKEQPLDFDMSWPGPPEEQFAFVRETLPPWRRALEQADAATRDELSKLIVDGYRARFDGEAVRLRGNAFIVSAQR